MVRYFQHEASGKRLKIWFLVTVVLVASGLSDTVAGQELATLREDVREGDGWSGSWFRGKPGGAAYREEDAFDPSSATNIATSIDSTSAE